MKFTLLGSGCCRPDLVHWGPAQVLEVAGQRLMFDCGRGATMRLVQAGIEPESIEKLFFTHHHYDHNVDFAYFFLVTWTVGRSVPLEVFGPRGTEVFCRGILDVAYHDDIASRAGHPQYSAEGKKCIARDVLEPTWSHEGDGYLLEAIHVVHKAPYLDNLAYRVTADGKTIVICGDNILCPNLMDFAEGADLLVHECTFPGERMKTHKWTGFHTLPADLGTWARERGVKRLMLKHYAVQPGVEVEPMVDEVRSTFGDEGLIAGADLMTVEV